jgi:hypothetical protein
LEEAFHDELARVGAWTMVNWDNGLIQTDITGHCAALASCHDSHAPNVKSQQTEFAAQKYSALVDVSLHCVRVVWVTVRDCAFVQAHFELKIDN